jgi:hypothetical protein
MTSPPTSPKACHNCRRQRLKCDRALPKCHKCIKQGQECQGYQRLFRWECGIASRGKMAGRTFDDLTQNRPARTKSNCQLVPPHQDFIRNYPCRGDENTAIRSMTDPLIQDVDQASRKYLFYCVFYSTFVASITVLICNSTLVATDVCKDLVLYDIPNHNPFRELIPLIHQHPMLLHIIVANSALHMSNSSQGLMSTDRSPSPVSQNGMDLMSCSSSLADQRASYYHALRAKQKALCLLGSALQSPMPMNDDVILAVVLLFIEFELLDSGRDDWKHHISGAKAIIEKLCQPKTLTSTAMTPLRRSLVSNFVVYVHSLTSCS